MTTFETLLQTFAQWRTADAAQEPGDAPGYSTRHLDQLLAYLVTEGNDGPLFDPVWYTASLDLPVPARNAARSALTHYLKTGIANRFDPVSWFDEAGYRDANPDVALGIAAGQWRCGYQHYLLCGIAESRSPGTSFNELAYLGRNPDILKAVRDGGLPNGALHYVRIGKTEARPMAPGRATPLLPLPFLPRIGAIESSTVFAEEQYRAANGDVVDGDRPAPGMRHWLGNGLMEDLAGQRARIEGWVENLYLRRNPDLVPFIGAQGQPTGYSHYLMYGAAEGRGWAGEEWAAAEAEHLALAVSRRTTALPAAGDAPLPVISLIVPVYNPDLAALRACIASVQEQTYPHWQLCLADDASTQPHVLETLAAAARTDARIRTAYAPRNGGISAASNAALALAEGEFVALLDHDDLLAPDALLELAKAFLSGPEVDMVYTDEAKLTEAGAYVGLNAKPGWSPELLLSTMYIGHLTAYRRSLVAEVGGFRSAFDGTQDYDLALRMAEVVRSVVHVPLPLYFWRMSPASTAGAMGAKPGVLQLQARALESALVRRGQPGVVRPGHQPGHWAVVLDPPADMPLVSIVIPSAGRSIVLGGIEVDLVVNCVRSLTESETYPRYEIVVVHNNDLRASTLLQLANYHQVRLVAYEATAFNLSDKINLGVAQAAGEFVLLLNDDMQAESRDIIHSMLGRMHEGVGIVGGRLLFANGTLQHAGVVWMSEGPTHAMIGEHRLTPGPAERLRVTHDVFGVSGACMFFRRSVFQTCGGFPRVLPLNYNDVELCLKVREHGLRVVFDPDVTLFHFESVSKVGTHFWELQQLLLGHGSIVDPYWNPNFSRRSPFFELRDPNQVERPSYRSWLMQRIAGRQAGLTADRSIRFSFIMSVYQNKRYQMEALAATIDHQSYDNWEWVIVDDGSTKPETLEWLERIQAHPRVRFVRLPSNQGIMAGYGAAFQAATGDYVVPIDADDFLTLDCLHVLASAIERMDRPDVVYSDEDKGTETGDSHSPFLKPDWDPVLFSNICYVCHVCAVKRETALAVGAYTDKAAAWCHDWDTLLRMKRGGARIEHVPEVLYHWRIHQGSTASIETGTKPYTIDSQRHVLLQDLRLSGADKAFELIENEMFPHNGIWRLRPLSGALPRSALLVAAASDPARTARFLGDLATTPRPADAITILVGDDPACIGHILPEVVRALWPDGKAVMHSLQQAAALCRAEDRMVAVVSAEVGRLNRSWLSEGLGLFRIADDVVAVGGQVIDAAGSVVWRGGYAGFGGLVGSPDYGLGRGDSGYHGTSWCQRTCDGVPAVCFFVMPGLLEEAVAGLDAAASLRLVAGQVAVLARRAGKRVVYTPFVQVTLDASVPVGPIPPAGSETVFEGGPVYYAAAFGRTLDAAYHLG